MVSHVTAQMGSRHLESLPQHLVFAKVLQAGQEGLCPAGLSAVCVTARGVTMSQGGFGGGGQARVPNGTRRSAGPQVR